MYDIFIPSEPIKIPERDIVINELQGKDGPNGLLVWKQGIATPIDQRVDEENRIKSEKRETFRLPDEFTIYDIVEGEFFGFKCKCIDGVWQSIERQDKGNTSS